MIDLKVGDKVQVDPALVNGGARKFKGVGTLMQIYAGGTRCVVQWSLDMPWAVCDYCAWELVLVSSALAGRKE